MAGKRGLAFATWTREKLQRRGLCVFESGPHVFSLLFWMAGSVRGIRFFGCFIYARSRGPFGEVGGSDRGSLGHGPAGLLWRKGSTCIVALTTWVSHGTSPTSLVAHVLRKLGLLLGTNPEASNLSKIHVRPRLILLGF